MATKAKITFKLFYWRSKNLRSKNNLAALGCAAAAFRLAGNFRHHFGSLFGAGIDLRS